MADHQAHTNNKADREKEQLTGRRRGATERAEKGRHANSKEKKSEPHLQALASIS